MELRLTRGKTAIVDRVDADLNDGRNWLCSLNTHSGKMYVYRRDLGARKDPRTLRYLHRVIAARMLGRPLKKSEVVDHADGDTMNNRRANLRVCLPKNNQANLRKIASRSGFKGVVQYRNRFAAFCGIDGGPRYLGSFASAELAAKAYDRAARLRAGEFAATNEDLKK